MIGRRFRSPSPARKNLSRQGVAANRFRVTVGIAVYSGGDFLHSCLGSVLDAAGFDQLVVVYDGVDTALQAELIAFCQAVGGDFFAHDATCGYTASANQILAIATGDIVVLLNSDTVVPHGWIERLLVPFADPSTGLAGPWSNAATFQSVPELPAMSGYSANDLPKPLDVEIVNAALICSRPATSPRVPALNGFCLAIRRCVVDAIGLFDATAFAEGYGEELDYAVRARRAGFNCRVADTLYVYHEKSQSFGAERRKRLSAEGKRSLLRLHGADTILELFSGLQDFAAQSPERQAAVTLLSRLQKEPVSFAALPPVAVDLVDRWPDIARVELNERKRPLLYVVSEQEVDEVLASPPGRTALYHAGITRHVCTSRALAFRLLRNTGLRAIVLSPVLDGTATPAWFNALNGADAAFSERR